MGVLFLKKNSISSFQSKSHRATHNDLVVMPSLMSLDFSTLAETSRTEVDLLTLLRSALDPDGMCDVDVAYIIVSMMVTYSGNDLQTSQVYLIPGSVADCRQPKSANPCGDYGNLRLTRTVLRLPWICPYPSLCDRHDAASPWRPSWPHSKSPATCLLTLMSVNSKG